MRDQERIHRKRSEQEMTSTRTTTTTKTNPYSGTLVALVAALALAASLLVASTARPAYASTTFTVNSTADTGAVTLDGTCNSCTLREAIQEANANGNPTEVDQINFNIPGTGVRTISPDSSLPVITEPVVINGYSQPGSSANTLARGTNAKLLIQLSGTDAGPAAFRGLTVSASNSVVKGLVINRFVNASGIAIDPESLGFPADLLNVRVEGNFIGTDPSGTLDQGNAESGVALFATSNNIIGGVSRASRNLISGNNFGGVVIEGAGFSGFGSADNNRVQGNLIGTQKDGIKPLGNGLSGVDVITDTTDTTANGNSILSNSIFSNDGVGIDLNDDDATANDPGDTDSGPNNLQNTPVISSAKTGSGKTTIKGTLNSRPGAKYAVQFFSNPSGTDEGQTFIGQKTGLTVDASGKGSFTFSPSSKVAAGRTITATATNESTGDTSEFSAAKGVVAG
jgi:CSLREA domain-containing protein